MTLDCTLGDTLLTSMQAQGLLHHLMRRSLSQSEGERGWYVYVCVCACVCDKYIYTYIRGHTSQPILCVHHVF